MSRSIQTSGRIRSEACERRGRRPSRLSRGSVSGAVALLLVAVLAAVLGGCSDSSRNTVVAPGSASAVSTSDTITVVGEASVKSAPDEAVLTVAVESDGKDPGAAMNKNSTAVSAVLERIKREGVDDKDIETANVTVYAIRTYTDAGQEKLTGYRATNTVRVTIADAKKVGAVFSAAIEAGANNVSGPVWQLSDNTKAVAEALKKAAQNARKKAEALADASGVGLGDVVMLSENSVQMPVYPMYLDSAVAKSDALGGVANTPISAASLDVTATVTVTFALKR
jgi:uncharacterized protein YggE